VALLVVLALIGISRFASAQMQCPNGQVPAPAGFGIFGMPQGACVNNLLIQQLDGSCSFNPYQALQSYAGSGVILAPQVGGAGSSQLQSGVNPVLACRLAQFLQYAQTQGYAFKISSGYRSAQQQANTCMSICGNTVCRTSQGDVGDCATPGNSCHQYGLAVDISGSTAAMNWAHTFLGFGSPGAGAQQYKIFFPLRSDSVHVQCIENTTAACTPSTTPCDGSVGITPDLNYTGPMQVQNPTSGFTNALRPARQSAMVAPQQQVAQFPQSYTQPIQQAPITTPISALAVPTSTTGNLFATLPQTQPITLPAAAPSTAQFFSIITNLSATTASSSLSLNQNLYSIINTIIRGNTSTAPQTPTSTGQSLAYTDTTIASGSVQYAPVPSAPLLQAVQQLKNVLLNFLSYLRSL
jgi:hypothetical protein